MESSKYPLDIILVPLSLFFIATYHAYIWQCSKTTHPATTIGQYMMKRRAWLANILPADDKKAMFGVQSTRNSLMSAILSASIAIIINSSLAAISNNTYKYNSSHILENPVFGSQSDSLLILKYASASLLFLFSFLCSSLAIGCIIEANFLISVSGELMMYELQAERMLKRGWALALVGNRVLYVAVWFLSWMFGPVPMALALVVMVLVFYHIDFCIV